jgi:hypothetical protein
MCSHFQSSREDTESPRNNLSRFRLTALTFFILANNQTNSYCAFLRKIYWICTKYNIYMHCVNAQRANCKSQKWINVLNDSRTKVNNVFREQLRNLKKCRTTAELKLTTYSTKAELK